MRRTWDADDGGYKIPQTAQRTIEVLAKDRDQWASRARVAESQVERSYAAGMTVREVELQQSLVGAYAREGDQRDKIVSLEAKFRSAQQRIRDLEEKLEKQ